jgi:DNA-binding NarL/FixJ family response regulator
VEHHPLIRQGLRRFLEMESKVAIVTEVESGEEALRVTRQWQPDIAIIDLALSPRAGIATVHTLKRQCPTTVVIALSLEDDEPYRRAVVEVGAAVLVRNDGYGQAILIALRGFMPTCSVQETWAEWSTHPWTQDGGKSAQLIQAPENKTSAPRVEQ